MSKIDEIKTEYLQARKSGNKIVKDLLSTFIGEYDNQSVDAEGGDQLVEAIAKKMTKSAETIGSEASLSEIRILSKYLPNTASLEEVKHFLKDMDLTLGGRLIGMAKKHFNGNVDPKTVNEAINALKA